MKYLILAIILLTSFTVVAEGDQSYYIQQYEKGNQAYEKEAYEEAVNLYMSINDAGLSSPENNYNLGNCFFKLGEIPKAILYYEKALKQRPDDTDILYNLEIANSMITDKVEPIPTFFLSKIWKSILNTFHMDVWAWISIILFLGSLISLFIYAVSNKIIIKKILFFNGSLLLIFTFFAILFAQLHKQNLKREAYAIVFSPTVNLLSEPKVGSTKLYVIHEGLKVKIIASKNDWVKVELADGNIGWISKQHIEKV